MNWKQVPSAREAATPGSGRAPARGVLGSTSRFRKRRGPDPRLTQRFPRVPGRLGPPFLRLLPLLPSPAPRFSCSAGSAAGEEGRGGGGDRGSPEEGGGDRGGWGRWAEKEEDRRTLLWRSLLKPKINTVPERRPRVCPSTQGPAGPHLPVRSGTQVLGPHAGRSSSLRAVLRGGAQLHGARVQNARARPDWRADTWQDSLIFLFLLQIVEFGTGQASPRGVGLRGRGPGPKPDRSDNGPARGACRASHSR